MGGMRGILVDRLAFRGGTCLRKMFIGSQGRFSTDMDFSGIEEHDHEDVILAMMEAFEQEFHGIKFHIPDDSYYETVNQCSPGNSEQLLICKHPLESPRSSLPYFIQVGLQ